MTLGAALRLWDPKGEWTPAFRRRFRRAYALGMMDCRRGREDQGWKFRIHNSLRPLAKAYAWGRAFWRA